MSLILNGTDGLSDVDGTAATPAIRGTDANTGIFFPAADTIAFSEGGAEAMRIDSSGNVGIGTSSPSTKLQISEGSVFASGANRGISLGEPNCSILGDSATSSAANIVFYTGNADRMRITSAGALLVGTTTVYNTATTNVGFVGNVGSGISINTTTATNGATFQVYLSTGTLIGSISNNNNTGVSYNTTSDYRLKENITPMTGALAKISQLKPVTYTWKSNGSDGEGFIAHELQAVVPNAVVGEKDAVDADGNIKPQGVDTSFLVATLTAALQELKAIVDAQAIEIAELKAK
jgi:hypothetical protein